MPEPWVCATQAMASVLGPTSGLNSPARGGGLRPVFFFSTRHEAEVADEEAILAQTRFAVTPPQLALRASAWEKKEDRQH